MKTEIETLVTKISPCNDCGEVLHFFETTTEWEGSKLVSQHNYVACKGCGKENSKRGN